jgi:nickel/cobalt exporter
MWNLILGSLGEIQTWINQSVAADLGTFAHTRDWLNLMIVLPLGAAFGAVHALTPGHSKTILVSYLAGSGLSVARGVGVAMVLALTHILTAVLIAALALPLVTRTLVGVGRAPLLEDASRGLLALIGVWMIARAWQLSPHVHAEGPLVGVIAGLIPCPLTLFAMVFSISRGIPEAGIVFAVAMMLGVAFTLSGLAVLTIITRDRFSRFLEHHGPTLESIGRLLEAAAGAILILYGVKELVIR